MEYRTLQHTDLKVSRLSFGNMTFGSQTDEASACRIVDRVLGAGINFFDTANSYNRGLAETILGKALGARRKSVVVASKVFNKMGDGPDDCGLTRAAMHKAIDTSLARLGTDYLDIYYLHQPDWATPMEETLATMDELVRAGKVRYPAVSNYAAWQVAEILWICEKHGYKPPHISQPMYNLIARGIEEEFLPFCKRFGVSVVPYNPLAGGLLTGKHKQEGGTTGGTRFDKNELYLTRYWHTDDFAAVEELRKIATRCRKDASRAIVPMAARPAAGGLNHPRCLAD